MSSPMNSDLKLRLCPFHQLSYRDSTFFHYVVERLAREALLGLPVHINGASDYSVQFHFEPIENGEDDSAYVLGCGGKFDIHIDERMPTGMIIDFALHELAHLHSWTRADDNEDHCEEFGKSYALLYRLYLQLYEEFWA